MSERTYAKFTFFKVDGAWSRRDGEARAQDKREFMAACEDFAQDRSLRAYSTVGTRGDVDLLLLSQSPILDDLHTFHVVLAQSGLAKWMTTPHSYLAMTKPSPYSEADARPEICLSDRKYLFVYPLDKRRDWYRLPLDERQRVMTEHIEVGRAYPLSGQLARTFRVLSQTTLRTVVAFTCAFQPNEQPRLIDRRHAPLRLRRCPCPSAKGSRCLSSHSRHEIVAFTTTSR